MCTLIYFRCLWSCSSSKSCSTLFQHFEVNYNCFGNQYHANYALRIEESHILMCMSLYVLSSCNFNQNGSHIRKMDTKLIEAYFLYFRFWDDVSNDDVDKLFREIILTIKVINKLSQKIRPSIIVNRNINFRGLLIGHYSRMFPQWIRYR